MKKKILSLFLALAMCLSLLPTAAFAADGAQYPAEPGEEILAPEQLGDPEKDPDPEQEEQQADPSVKQDEAVAAVQALMDALPGEVTADNADELQAQLMAIDAALEALSDEQLAQFLTRYEAVCEALSSLTAVQAGETHEHYLCGGADCNKEGHAQEDGTTTFKAWDKTAATTTGGAYYLTGDVYGFTVPEGVNLTLCLNGFSITGNWDGPIVTVEPGATLTLCNCKSSGYIGHDRNVYGAGVFVGEKDDSMEGTGQNTAAFYMYGGTIGGNSDSATKAGDYIYGSGVVVMGGTFYMYGGAIKNNSVNTVTNKSYGGGVSVFNNGTFNMSGGTITGNTGYYGGGVSVGLGVGINHAQNKTGGTFTMSGGRIYNNAATYKAGGVYVSCGSNTIFTVSGSAQITDNYLGSLYTRGADNNVYLLEGNTKFEVEDAIINVGTLDSSASIGVTTEKGEQIVATGVSPAAEKCFTSDSSNYRLKYDSSESTLTMIAAAHSKHPFCGDVNCTNNDHALPGESSWKGVSSLSSIMSQGYYYLTKDVEINGTWQAPNGVKLCLNGYRIIETGDVDAIKVNNGNIFTLCDCVGTGEITHTEGKTGRGVKVQGTFNLYGGAITGNKCSTDSSYGSGVYVDSGACFNMHGGSITGNKNTVSRCGYGAGVYVNKGTFNMTGGSITKNTATYGAGVWTNVSFTVSGAAKIIDNSKDNAASNVYLSDNNKPITIGEGGLAASAKIGVTTGHEESIESGKHVTVATGAANSCTADNFSADKGGELGIKVEQGADADSVNVNLYNGLPHIHYRCNGKDEDGNNACTKIGGHTDDKVLEFKPWAETNSLPTTSGEYYLTKDVTLDSTWSFNGTNSSDGQVRFVLCLNGHSITLSESATGNVLDIGSYATLALCDCNGSKAGHGEITGAKGNYSGVNIASKGAFAMYGGTIRGNAAGVSNNDLFHMFGGTITGNYRGVYANGDNFIIAGDVTISGNGANGNIYLTSGKTITVSGALSKTAQIGVSTASKLASGNYVTVAQGKTRSPAYTLTLDDLNAFSSDANYDKQLLNGKIVFTNGVMHQHAICGSTAENCKDGHDDKLWLPILDESALRAATAGYYYLTKDITLWNGTWEPKDGVVLCLNGHSIEANVASDAITVNSGMTFTLTDCKGTTGEYGKITHWGDDKNGRGVSVNGQNAEFIMYGGNISGNTVTGNGGGVYVNDRATFTMYGGEISGNKATGTNNCGGGVYVSADATNTNRTSTFNMYGGTISGNEATDGSGGGVYVYYSTFNMYGGTIGGSANTGNKAYGKGGGGVYVYNGKFNMSGSAAVSGNSTADSAGTGHGGGVYVDGIGGTFTMSGSAAVSGNTASGNGGGVYVENRGSSFNMSGSAAVSDNTASGSGGGVYVNCSTFTMNAGTISGNETTGANSDGGGVCVAGLDNDTSTFTMKNGTISGNSAKNGGGVYVSQSTFTMSNGTISGNNAAYSGGGVYVTGNSSNSGAFTMTSGTVTGNNAASTNGSGGVYVAIDANMTVSGSVQIKDNWKNGTLNTETGVYENGSANNLYLFAYETDKVLKTVTIGGDLTGAKIGVTTRYTPEEKGSILIATGAPTDHAKFFTPDVTGQGYTITQEGEKLYLSAHTHHWKYENSSSAAIKVTCDAPGCNLKSGFEVTYTLTASEESTLTYDGTGKPATVNPYSVEIPNGVTLPEPSAISYTQTEPTFQQLEATAVPTNAGTYTASITMGGVTASVDYEIKKATPTADDFTFTPPTSLTYDGNPKTATVTSTKIDASYVTVKYYQDGTEVSVPTNAGTYTVKIDVTESGNYFAASGLNANDWMFAIAKNTTTPTMTLDQYYSLTYKKSQLTPPVTVTINGKSLTENVDYTVTYGKNIDAGELAGSVTINPMGNYEFRQIVRSFTIDARYIAVTASDKTSRVGQNLVALTYTCTKGLPYEGDTFTGELATNANKNTAGTYQITQGTLSLGNNYNIAFTPGTYTVEDKQPQTGFKFENAAVTKIYGNADFTITATDQVDGSSVTYSSSNEAVATVDSTGKVTIKGAGTAKITATASATEEYAEKEISCTLTVSPKTLTAADLEFTANSTFTKEYDGTTNCTTATVQINSDAKVNNGDALPEVKGAYAYDSKDVTGATKVTFTSERTENTNYILPANLTVENAANITKHMLTVGTVTATSKKYDGETDAEACIASVPLNGVVDGDSLELDTPTTDGSYYFTADFIDANAGQNKTINGTVVLYPNKVTANYTFKDAQGNETNEATFTTTGAIAKADSWALTSVNNLTIRYNNRAEQTYTPDWPKLLPAGQKWTYNLEDTKVTGSAVLADHSIGADSGVLTYQLSAGAENDTVTWTITASCNNYESFTLTVKLTLIARNEQTGFAFKDVVDGKVTKTYGDADFTIKATGAATNSSVTYESSDETVATVDSTGKVTIKGAGTATIKAKASATPDYEEKEISYALTVNKLRIPVPTKGTNELEYTGQEQTYLPDGLDPIYCTIESNKATNVIAGGSWHNADVSLKDRSNTEWADGADSTAHRPYPFRITPKPVTVTALDKKITAGQPAPELTSADYTVTGLIGNDTLGGISLYYADPSDLSKAVTPDTGKAGTYAIVVTKGGTGSNNYAPTFVNGTLTIASRPSGGVVAVTYPVNVPGETERGSVSSNVKNASKGSTVTITVEPEDGFQLADLTVTDKDGNELPLTDKGDGKYTFTMPAGKVEVNATFAEKIETSSFADVSTDAYYYEAVKWAAEQGITGGVGGGLFAPDQSCTRAQIVTFLWRAAGSPEPKSMRSFSDVPEDSYYAKAVAWAVENGITVGTSATTFSPDATCTRAQGVTFLFRAAKASADGAPAFRDVAADAYYAAAVKWATDNSVTNGIGGGLFGSDNDCTRAQIVTFLWRLYAGK